MTTPEAYAAARARLVACAEQWGVVLEQTVETESSLIAYGRQRGRAVVLKVTKRTGDEWRSGRVLAAFAGRSVVRVIEHTDGAALLERLEPGTPLAPLALAGRDEDATRILADVVGAMAAPRSLDGCPTVHDWALGFTRYRSSNASAIAEHLVAEGEQSYLALCGSQANPRLLHGDLHHYNVLFDRDRSWVAIDPKGVVGEVEYELGAALRNPTERPELFTDPATIEHRLACFASVLGIDADRALRWAFAQAVLSAIWSIEDGYDVTPDHSVIRLAETLRAIIAEGGRR